MALTNPALMNNFELINPISSVNVFDHSYSKFVFEMGELSLMHFILLQSLFFVSVFILTSTDM